jgi:AcrR family transcriptional regulator
MNAAQQLFLDKGVVATTIEQITAAAGVAKGTFYLYFSSKDDVLVALRPRYAQHLLASIEAAIAKRPVGDWKGKLTAWAKGGVSGYLDSTRLHDMLFYSSPPPNHAGLVDNVVIDHLCEMLEAGTDAQAWTVEDPRFTAIFLFSGLHGILEAYGKDKKTTPARMIAKLESACFNAVTWPS